MGGFKEGGKKKLEEFKAPEICPKEGMPALMFHPLGDALMQSPVVFNRQPEVVGSLVVALA